MYAAHKANLAVLSIISLLVLSACASSAGHQVAAPSGQVQTQADAGIRKGQLPPDFTITTIDGKQLNLREFKDENKPILLYFWASWCPYCKQDLSIVKEVYPKYADKVKFIARDLDVYESADKIRKYSENIGLPNCPNDLLFLNFFLFFRSIFNQASQFCQILPLM